MLGRRRVGSEVGLDPGKELSDLLQERVGFKRLHDARRQIYRLCTAYARMTPADQKSGKGAAIGEQLEPAARRYAREVCTIHKVVTVWQDDFVAQLLERPDHAEATLTRYRDGIAVIAKNTTRELPLVENGEALHL